MDILYENAIFFKEKVLPYYFIFKHQYSDLIIEATESDFAHLVGRQHSANTIVKNYKSKIFLEKVLNHEISLNELIQNHNEENYTEKQTYIYNKNVCFKLLFETISSNPNLRAYNKEDHPIKTFDFSYVHNKDEINGLAILCIKKSNKYHSFASIQFNDSSSFIKEYTKAKKINVHKIDKIRKADFKSYLDENPISLKTKKDIKKRRIISKRHAIDINNILHNNSLSITIGDKGKDSIQVWKQSVLIATKITIPDTFITTDQIAEFINKKYGEDE